ncbi:MAG: EAL domain-containing protein [Actinobacteria bacterium]|nr:EAL domain-containing protein [Actinomycetota bacterium]NBP54059.1 EAL domain-containing protein [Actinomycetota bacterium]
MYAQNPVRTSFSRIAWVLVVLGIIAGVCHALVEDQNANDAIYLAATILLAVGVIAGLATHRPSAATWSLVLAIAVFSTAAQILDGAGEGTGLRIATEAGFLAVQVTLAGALLVVTVRRSGASLMRSLGDGLIVALGTWILIWVLLIQPSIDAIVEPNVVTGLRGVTLATSTVVLFLLASLLFSDANRTTAVWMLSGAIGLSLVGDLLYALEKSGHLSVATRYGNAPYVTSLFFAAATFLHPSVRGLSQRGSIRLRRPFLGRLVLTTLALIVPLLVVSTMDPHDRLDRVVRTVSLFVLATAVTARVIQAVRDNARSQAVLVELAQTDPLTQLPNRNLMLDHIADALEQSWRADRRPTVLFIDVDRFKNINDSLGHGAGDDVLLAVARRLRNTIPERAHVGRISGDEFVVLDPASRTTGDAMQLAERVLAAFHEPLQVSQGDVFVSASIGVALGSPTGSLTAEELLRNADTAMYRAKDAGRNCIAIFDDSMLERVTQRLSLETALYRALERRELRLVHQPIIDIQLGDVIGFEALMRWEQEDGTTVSPAEFIPIAEETGTIVPIGAWALLEALSHLRDWINRGVCPESASMSVNVSPRQLHDPNFTSAVNEALTRSRIRPQQLWLEVTEGVMIAEPDQALSTLRRLNALGVRVAIDDFGTGYSSLSLLQRFPIQRLKIDRAFISGIADDVSARSLVKTIIAMADALGLDTVAEGVESIRQLQSLADLRCAKAQGFLISHPVHPDAMESTLAALERFTNWPKLR